MSWRVFALGRAAIVAGAERLMPYECHEGNYGLKNILSAARAEEAAAK